MNENDILFDSTRKNISNDIIFNDSELTATEYDLVFDDTTPSKDNNIYFGGIGELPKFPPVYGILTLSVPKPTLSAKGKSLPIAIQGILTLATSTARPSLIGYYNVNNPFEFLNKRVRKFQEACEVTAVSSDKFRNGVPLLVDKKPVMQKAVELFEDFSSKFVAQVENPLFSANLISFEKTESPIAFDTDSVSYYSEKLFSNSKQKSQRAYPLGVKVYRFSLQQGDKTTFKLDFNFQKSENISCYGRSSFHLSELAYERFTPSFQLAENLSNPTGKVVIKPPITPEPILNNDIIFECLAKEWEQNSYDYTIIFNDTCELKIDRPTDYSEPIFVKNTFTLKNLETGQEIKATDLSFSTDVDSYAWTGSMTIPDNQVEFLKSPTNKAVLIEYIFNDIKAVFQVGKVSRNITFGQRSYKVKLSSPSIKLDEPISGVDSYTNQDTLTPSAYAEKLIDPTNNGINLIWDFLSPLEWVINKGAFTYQNLSPIKAIGSMLENSGAFISSSLDGKNLIVKRKRPVVFWEEIDSSKIINIPTGVITSLGYEIEHLQHFNGVYVLADDRTVFVRRRETNGAVLAPQIVAKQLTSNQACVEAGRYVLANAGIVETHDLAKPILNDGVLLNPADIVKFVLDDVTYIGTVISTSVAIKFNSQYQTFKVEVIKGFN